MNEIGSPVDLLLTRLKRFPPKLLTQPRTRAFLHDAHAKLVRRGGPAVAGIGNGDGRDLRIERHVPIF